MVMEGIQGDEALFGLKRDLGNKWGFCWSQVLSEVRSVKELDCLMLPDVWLRQTHYEGEISDIIKKQS